MAGTPAGGPLITEKYTQLRSKRFAPAFGFEPNAKPSFGLASTIDYSNLDLERISDMEFYDDSKKCSGIPQ